jgi:hypothetical protein
MSLRKGYGVRITPSGGALVTIGGVTQQSMMTGSEILTQETAGTAFVSNASINAIRPRGTFTTHSVGALWTALGLRGACLAGGANPGFEMHELLYSACGALVTTTTPHRKLTIPNGLVIPQNIECSHQQDATMSAEVIATHDGTNDPVIIGETVAMPTGLTDTHRFTLGAVSVGNISVTGILSVSVDFGNNATGDSADSNPFDDNVELTQILPTITIRTRDVAKFAAAATGIPLRGLKGIHTNTSIVLRRRVNGTASFSTAADNIRITADCLINWDEVFNAAANARGEGTIRLTCLDDATNAPVVIVTNFEPA